MLAGLAPQLGAAGALFVSDERTEVFLRDQRRSKAHRALVPDAGAPCDEVLNVDLGAVDPLYMDETGAVRSVRDLNGKPVSQVLLGGDTGATLRDLFAAAALLKSKRVPARVEFLVAIPSRQMLEVLAGSGALTDLIATGARLIEPDARVMTGELYPPAPAGTQRAHARSRAERHVAEERRHRLRRDARLRRRHRRDGRSAQLQAPGPRHHPARAPHRRRARRARSQGHARRRQEGRVARAHAAHAVEGHADPRRRRRPAPTSSNGGAATTAAQATRAIAVVCSTLDEVRELAARAVELAPRVRAVLAPFIPSGAVVALQRRRHRGAALRRRRRQGPQGPAHHRAPGARAVGRERAHGRVALGRRTKVPLTWLALGPERALGRAPGPRVPPRRPPARCGAAAA